MTPQTPSNPLAGLRILVAEDEMMVAMSLVDLLALSACHIVKTGQMEQALELARTETLDGALLDVNLRGERVYPVAEALDQRAIPFIFLTGYSAAQVEAPWDQHPVLEKPIDPDALEQTIAAHFSAQN